MDQGVLSASDIVRERVSIETIERKNVSFVVRAPKGSVFLKRPRVAGDQAVAREAAVYRHYRKLLGGETWARITPRFLTYDPERGVLATEFLDGSSTLRDAHSKSARSGAFLGKLVATALSALHAPDVLRRYPTTVGDAAKPWAFSLLEPPIEILASESSASIEIVRKIQAEPIFRNAVLRANDVWTLDALCHNDVRLDNLMLLNADSGVVLKIVDWELSEPGWGYWDAACFLAAYVEMWCTWPLIRSQSAPPALWALPARRGIRHYHRLIGAFWRDYARGRGKETNPATSREMASLVAVRLLQSAMEYSQQSNAVTRESLALLELARQFASEPLQYWVHILGLPISAESGPLGLYG